VVSGAKSSQHSDNYYHRRKLPKPDKQETTKSNTDGASAPSIIKFLRFVGIALIVGGFGVMVAPTLYWYGMPAVQVGFAALVAELYTDTTFRKKHFAVGVVLALVCLCSWVVFNYRFVFIAGQMKPSAAAMMKGNYPSGTEIGSIKWDNRLTDMRVVISNPTDDDYQQVDVTIRPDVPVYSADKLSGPSNCDLQKIPGPPVFGFATAQGGKTTVTWNKDLDEIQDNVGDPFSVVLSGAGYRLTCDKFPSHSAIKLVFALGRVDQKFELHQHSLGSGDMMTVEEIAGAKTPFDMFGPRPYPSWALLHEKYTRRFKPFDESQDIDVVSSN
jgi:hypothetical protein